MLLRPLLSRIRRDHRVANYCTHKSVEPLTATRGKGTTPTKGKSPEKGYVVSYLVNSCGLSAEDAVSASKRVDFDELDKPDAVLNFLEEQGFSKTQIAEHVRKQPRVLVCEPEKSLLPKIDFFVNSAGIPRKDALAVLLRHPYSFRGSLKHRLVPVYNYLEDIIGTVKARTLLMRGSRVFSLDSETRLIPNVDYLRKLGVPVNCIELGIVYHVEIFVPEHIKFREVVEEVKQMDIDPMKSMFIMAIHARTERRNLAVWDKCYEVYSKWGWSKDDIILAFRKHPNCMLLSEKKISRTLDFLVNKLGRDSRSVAHYPSALLYNLEKRIIPRCSIVDLLSSKGLVKKDWSLATVLGPAENIFLERYVTKYAEEVPNLYDIYQEKLGSSKLESSTRLRLPQGYNRTRKNSDSS